MADQSKATPRPTTPYFADSAATNTITSALPLPSNVRRQDSAPWGYASGDPASPLYHSCPSGYSQTLVGKYAIVLGCCRNGVCVNNVEHCAAYLENTSFFTNLYPSWTSCPAETPACVTYTVKATTDLPIISYACGGTSAEIDVARSVAGEVDENSAPARVSASATSATSTKELSSTSTVGLEDHGGSNPSSSADLVKILVPVIIGVAIILGAVFIFFRKRKQDKEKRRRDAIRYGPADVLPLKPVRNDRHDNHDARHDGATGGDGGHMHNGNIYGNVYYTPRSI